MRLAIMQPYFFPYIGYFQLISAADKFILYDDVCYIKKGWIHRNRIRLRGRDPIYCSVPVSGASSFAKIRNVRVDHSRRWPGKFIDLLTYNYRKAPFFDEVFPVIENAVRSEAEYLTEINCRTITAIIDFLGIATTVTDDVSPYRAFEEAVPDPENGFTHSLAEEFQVTDVKTLRVLYICRMENARMYINPIGGQKLYARDQFARNNLELRFLQSSFAPYPQYRDPFVPGLSIIDVLMHCGREGTQAKLKDYVLI